MYGVVTRNEEELEWTEFDLGFYEVKDVTGRQVDPVSNGVNMVSCFGDNATAADSPDLVPVNPEGELATRDRAYFDWAYICPTAESYREGLLEIIETCTDANEDVRLDDVGFPRQEYCYCDRCNRRFEAWVQQRHDRGTGPPPEETDAGDRFEWRAELITDFVAEATERIGGRAYLTLYPDPYPGHIYERAGIDIEALSEYVDEFVIPLYDMAYSTTYWLEILARGFEDALSTPFSIELYAVQVELDSLVQATTVAEEYAKDVFFGYDASNARAALRRMEAESRDGVSHG